MGISSFLAAAIAHEEKWGHSLTAYLVGPTLEGGELARVQHEARRRLPAYMIPAHWRVLSALPLTANGKVDRKKLEEQEG